MVLSLRFIVKSFVGRFRKKKILEVDETPMKSFYGVNECISKWNVLIVALRGRRDRKSMLRSKD